MGSGERVLLYGDVDAIKEYVFEVASLPQIRGGSQLLIECEGEVQAKVKARGGREIYCGGGSFLFEVPSDQAPYLAEEIQQIYLRKTSVATVTVVYEDGRFFFLPLKDWSGNSWARRLAEAAQKIEGAFAQRVALLSARLREAKLHKESAPFFEAFPFGRRCDGCGKRMAVGEAILKLCPVCTKRFETGKTGEKGLFRGKFNEEFSHFASPKAQQAPDLDNLVGEVQRKYLAFLYADGNEIGDLLQKVRSEEEYVALSKALKEGTRQALFDSLREICQNALAQEGYWPFEIISIGGDDVTLLIQAGYAWEVAVQFLTRFEEEVDQRVKGELGYWPEGWPSRVTASCGVAIADVKYPIYYLQQMASGLLKRAKTRAKEDRRALQSAVNFLWLRNPVGTGEIEPLMDYYTREDRDLTARPYTLAQARQIGRLAEKALQWPRTRRYYWAEALERGVLFSINAIHYDIARSEETERSELSSFLKEVGEVLDRTSNILEPFWRVNPQKEKKTYYTALLDILELAELLDMRRGKGDKEKAGI